MIGAMTMPKDFEYADVFAKGQPRHQKFDHFSLTHPPMDRGHRAKLFAPFDALAGFDDAIAAKNILYEYKKELSDEEKEEMNRRLGILHRMTLNGKLARENQVMITITYYAPCKDTSSFSYGYRGQYVTLYGICKKITIGMIQVSNTSIPLEDIFSIESNMMVAGRKIFDTDWEMNSP